MIRRLLGAVWVLLGMSIGGMSVGGCHNPDREQQSTPALSGSDSPAKNPAAGETILTDTPAYSYDSFRVNSEFQFPDSVELSDTTHYQLNFPFFEDEQIRAFVMRAQLGTDTTDIQGAARQFIAEYEAYQATVPFPRAWTYESSSKVNNMTPRYLGLETEHYTYTGGAHGMYAIWFSHYWLPTNEELGFADLIDTGRMTEFLPIAERYFWEQEKRNNPDMDPELYFFADQEFHVPENLTFEKDSLLFLYNIYEIKPYVYGQTKLRIPYPEIQEFLTEKARQVITGINKKQAVQFN